MMLSLALPAYAEEIQGNAIAEQYFNQIRNKNVATVGFLTEIPSLSWEDKESLFQDLRKNIDRELDIYALFLLDYPRLRLLRNEVYAKHGYVFKNYYLSKYFDQLGYKAKSEAVILSNIEKKNVEKIQSVEYAKKIRKFYGYYFNDELFKNMNEMVKIDDDKIIKINSEDKDPSELNEEFDLEFIKNGKKVKIKKSYSNRPNFNNVDDPGKFLGYYEKTYLFGDPGVLLIRGWDEEFNGDLLGSRLIGAYDFAGNLIFNSNDFFGDVGYNKETSSFFTCAQNGRGGVTDIDASIVKADGKTVASYKNVCGYANFVKPINSDAYLLSLGTIAKGTDFCEGGIKKEFGRLVFFDVNGLIVDQEFNGDIFSLYPSDHEDKAKSVLIDENLIYFSKRGKEFFVRLSKSVPFTKVIGVKYLDIPKYDNMKEQGHEPIENPTFMWVKELVGKCNNVSIREPKKRFIVNAFSGDEPTSASTASIDLCDVANSSTVYDTYNPYGSTWTPWKEMDLSCEWYGCSLGFVSEYIGINGVRGYEKFGYATDLTSFDINKKIGKGYWQIKKVSDQYFLFVLDNGTKIAAIGDMVLNDFIKRGVYP